MADDPIINVEDNTLTYRVVLDPSDIARQAEEIRNQLDQVLSSDNTTQIIGSTEFVTPQFNLQPGEFNNTPISFAPTLDTEYFEKAKEQINSIYEDIALGLVKLRQDMALLMDFSGNAFSGGNRLPENIEAKDRYADLLPETLTEKIIAMMGLGGDITGPIAPSKYSEYAKRSLESGFYEFLQNPGEFISQFTDDWAGAGIVGMATYAGAHFIPGVGQALFAVETAGLIDQWLSAAYNKREDLAEGFQEIARQQFGNISKDEARAMAQSVTDFVNSYQGYAQQYSIEEVSANLLQFANEGGFSRTYNVEEMQKWITTITEEMRQISRNLGVFQDEAVSIVAELAQKSMATSDNIREITEQMKAYGRMLGRDPLELLQGAVGTAEQFRQAGMYETPQAAMQIYLDANLEVQKLIRSNDPFIQSSIYRMGGPQGVSQGLISMYASYQNSVLGNYTTMSQYAGGSGDINVMAQAIGNNFKTLDDFSLYYGRGREQTLQDQSLLEAQFNYVENLATMYTSLGGTFSWEALEGFALLPGMEQLTGGLTKDQIRLAIKTVSDVVENISKGQNPYDLIKYKKIVSLLDSAKEEGETTFLGEVQANTIRYIDDLGRVISYGYGEAKRKGIDTIKDAIYQRIDTYGEWSTTKKQFIGFSTNLGGPSYIDPDGPKLPDNYNIYVDIETEFAREQVSAGRYSLVGQDLEEAAREILISSGITADNIISMKIDAMWGINSQLTADEKYAIEMWSNTPVMSIKSEGYYQEEIEKLLRDDPSILYNEKGEVKSLSEIIQTFDQLIKPYKEGMPDQVRKQLIFQASSVQKNETLRGKIINKKDAEEKAKNTWTVLEEGNQLRKESFTNLKEQYNTTILSHKEALKTYIADNIYDMDLDTSSAFRLYEAMKAGLENLSEFKEQLSPEQMEKKYFEYVQEEYGKRVDQRNLHYSPNEHVSRWENSLSSVVTKLLGTGAGGEIFEDFKETISKRNVTQLQQSIYEGVEKSISNLKGRNEIDFNVADISAALYTILPQRAASGEPISVSNLTYEQLVAASELMKQLRASPEVNENLMARIKTFADQFNIKEEDVTKKLNVTIEQIKELDDKEMGTNIKKMKDDVGHIMMMIARRFREKLPKPESTGNVGQ